MLTFPASCIHLSPLSPPTPRAVTVHALGEQEPRAGAQSRAALQEKPTETAMTQLLLLRNSRVTLLCLKA